MEIKNIVLIGAGNVATHLGRALHRAGYTVLQVYSRTIASASVLAEELGCSYTISSDEITPEGELYIVSVKDAVMETLLPYIVARNPNALFVHTAGSVSVDIWKNLATRYGVLYPMQTFSKGRDVDFSQVSFFVEAVAEADVACLMELAMSLGSKAYEANSEQRRYLHIAAVFACNFSNHMYAIAHHLLDKRGLPFDAMYPLIDETVHKLHTLSPVQAQTGPAQRNDTNVMDTHLQMLADETQLAELYKLLSDSILKFSLLK